MISKTVNCNLYCVPVTCYFASRLIAPEIFKVNTVQCRQPNLSDQKHQCPINIHPDHLKCS